MENSPSYPKETERLLAVEVLRLMDANADAQFDRVTRLLKAVTGAEIAAFTVVGRDREWFKSAQGLHRIDLPLDFSIGRYVILQEALITEISDIGADPRFANSPFADGDEPIHFYAGVPVFGPNKMPVGTLCVMDRRRRILAPEHAGLMRDLAAVLEGLLQLRMFLPHDLLTGVYNRRTFDEMYDREWRRAYRLVQPLSALVITPDYVNEYGAVYGAAKADELVRRIAVHISSVLRRGGDLLAYHGDRKFVAVLPETTLEQVSFVAENIFRAVHTAAIDHPGSPVRRASVSIGGACVVTLNDFHAGPQALIARAEEALQAAQAEGGNRTVMAVPEAAAAEG